MRLYTFINYYLSSIQQGIQTAHVTHELFNKYAVSSAGQVLLLNDWSRNHKTIITLNGGNNKALKDLLNFFDDPENENPYPYTSFNEDEDSLGGIMTGVGIVLPEKIYDAAELIRKRTAFFSQGRLMFSAKQLGEIPVHVNNYTYTSFEVELIQRMNDCPLAR